MKKVLVLDDDSLCLHIVVRHLERNGFEVLRSEDSAEALMQILHEQPDAIVTDIQMPGMSGWELIRVVRSWTKTALIPVIFLTQLGSEEDRMRGFQLGADDYLVKPVHADRLLVQLESVLESSESYLRAARRQLQSGAAFNETAAMFGIPSFLSLLEEQALSGTIWVEAEAGHGALQVSGGKIFHAAVIDGAAFDSLDSVFQILRWPSARYRFVPGPVHTADLIARSTTQILVEAATAIGSGPAAVGLKPSLSGSRCAITRQTRKAG